MSNIIKAERLNSDIPVAFNFEDLTSQAQHYLDQVRTQAAELIRSAEQQADAIRVQAEEQGRQRALQSAENLIEQRTSQRLETLLPALQNTILEISHAKHLWQQHWEKNVVQLALAIAERIIRKELSFSPEIPVTLVAEALQLAAGSSQLKIYLNPSDHKALCHEVQQLLKEPGRLGEAEIIADQSVSPGGCRVETIHGSIDQTFEAQLQRIAEELL